MNRASEFIRFLFDNMKLVFGKTCATCKGVESKYKCDGNCGTNFCKPFNGLPAATKRILSFRKLFWSDLKGNKLTDSLREYKNAILLNELFKMREISTDGSIVVEVVFNIDQVRTIIYC